MEVGCKEKLEIELVSYTHNLDAFLWKNQQQEQDQEEEEASMVACVSQTLTLALPQTLASPPIVSPSSFHGRPVPRLLFSSHLRFRHGSSLPPVMASSSLLPSPESLSLSPISVFTPDGTPVPFHRLWDQSNGTAVVAFLRHFGCPLCWEFAASLRDVNPTLSAAGVKLIAIGVGTPDKARILAERLPFPRDCLYADPDRKAYDALGLYYGLGRTFFNPASAKVISRFDTIQKALKGYTPKATPEDRSSVLQQGGLYIFRGTQLLFSRKDEGTGDHASLDDVLSICCPATVA